MVSTPPAPLVALILSLISALASAEATRPWPHLRPGPYSVGYRTVELTDHGRTYSSRAPSDAGETARRNFREVRVSLWYPAIAEAARRPMRYRDYVEASGFETLHEGVTLYGSAGWIAHSQFGDADADRLASILEQPTLAYRDAPAIDDRFPAIVYAPSFSYEAFENSALFEHLASHGYVIAASRSSGPDSRSMSPDLHGAETSARDLELLIEALHRFGQADLSRIGAAGFSWGGMTAALFAMRHQNVAAVLALDGSFEHAELAIEEHYAWQPTRLRGGYLAVVGDREPKLSMDALARYADVFELRFPTLGHWDFASDMIYTNVHAAANVDDGRRRQVDDAFGIIAGAARWLFDGYLKDDATSRKLLLEHQLRTHDPELAVETRVARAGLPAPPTTTEFAQLLRSDPQRARRVLAEVGARDPEAQLVDWNALQDEIVVSPFERKLEMLELIREELGESSIYFNNLGQAWRLEGDRGKALDYFRSALEHNPDSGFARRSIEELETEIGE